MHMSTTHSSFDQYCISHKTISNRAAAAPGSHSVLVIAMTINYRDYRSCVLFP